MLWPRSFGWCPRVMSAHGQVTVTRTHRETRADLPLERSERRPQTGSNTSLAFCSAGWLAYFFRAVASCHMQIFMPGVVSSCGLNDGGTEPCSFRLGFTAGRGLVPLLPGPLRRRGRGREMKQMHRKGHGEGNGLSAQKNPPHSSPTAVLHVSKYKL